MKTMTFVAGAAVGYVLGARAGRERYQQIVERTRTLAEHPTMRKAQARVTSWGRQGAEIAADKAGDARDALMDTLPGGDDNDAGQTDDLGSATASRPSPRRTATPGDAQTSVPPALNI